MNSETSKLFDSFESAGIYGVNYNVNQQELRCPQPECQDRKKKNAKALSVNVSQGLFKCHHCDWHGRIKDKNFIPVEKKEYKLPRENKTIVGQWWIDWFQKRGIESHVLERFKIGEYLKDGEKWVTFPYYRDNVLINNKSRSEHKDFRLSGGAELIFYNLDSIKDKKEAVIVEGEPDVLAAYQANIFNCVSVPNGGSAIPKSGIVPVPKLEYLDNCWKEFEDKERIILFIDNDPVGNALKEELARRLGRERCWIVEPVEGCKDANDILVKHGSAKLNEVIKHAVPYPIKDVSKPKDFLEQVLDYHENGYPQGDKIGFGQFDKIMSFRPGELTVITGIPNSGKSTFLDQILVRLASRHGWRHAVLSREQSPHAIHITKLTEIFTGRGINKRDGMTRELVIAANKFLNEHFFMFGFQDLTISGILERARQLVKQYGIKSLVVDPWNTLEHNTEGFSTETDYVNQILKEFVKFKDEYSVHVFLVAHPKKIPKVKEQGGWKIQVPELYDISGSAHFANMTDNGITMYRNLGTRQSKTMPLGDTVTAHVQKVRNKFIGSQGQVTFDYNFIASTYSEEYMPFINEIDDWRFRKFHNQPKPLEIVLDKPIPPQTDIYRLPLSTEFEVIPAGIPIKTPQTDHFDYTLQKGEPPF